MKYKDKHNRLNQGNKVASADFTRESKTKAKKRKVGTGPVGNHNATNTAVKFQQIIMPGQQSVNKDAKQQRGEVSHRNLSVDELLTHSKHNSAAKRADALLGLREIMQDYREFFEDRASHILERAFELMIDDEKSVRHALLLLLKACFAEMPQKMTARPSPRPPASPDSSPSPQCSIQRASGGGGVV